MLPDAWERREGTRTQESWIRADVLGGQTTDMNVEPNGGCARGILIHFGSVRCLLTFRVKLLICFEVELNNRKCMSIHMRNYFSRLKIVYPKSTFPSQQESDNVPVTY